MFADGLSETIKLKKMCQGGGALYRCLRSRRPNERKQLFLTTPPVWERGNNGNIRATKMRKWTLATYKEKPYPRVQQTASQLGGKIKRDGSGDFAPSLRVGAARERKEDNARGKPLSS